MYGLGQLGQEYVASCSQSSSLSNSTSALDYEAMMAGLNAKLAEKDLKIYCINNELAEKDCKIEQFGTELKKTQGLVQQRIQCVGIRRSSFTSAQPSLDRPLTRMRGSPGGYSIPYSMTLGLLTMTFSVIYYDFSDILTEYT